MKDRVSTVTAVFAAAFRNPVLRNVGFAYALFSASEFGIWIVFLVYAYARGGASAELTITLVQLVPCVVLAPVIGAGVDRWRPDRTLVAGYALQAVVIGAVAGAMAADAPIGVVYVLAPLTCLAICLTRPSQSALLPSVVRTAEELTAANVMTGWTEGAAALVGPGLAGLVLAGFGESAAMATMGALTLVAAALSGRVALDARTRAGLRKPDPDPAARPDAPDAPSGGLLDGVRGTLLNPQIRVLLIVTTFYFLLLGSLDYLCVVLALGILHMGAGGAGFLNAAIGTGELVAGFLTAFLVGRSPLARTLSLSLLGSVAALALVAAFPRVGVAVGLFVVVGLSLAVFNAAGKTLMQRAAPPDAIAGAFGVLESLMNLGLALGSLLAWAGYRIAGPRAALIAPAVAAVILIAALWKRLRQVDATATIPQVEIRLLRSIRIFAPLPAPAIEAVARELVPVTVPAGTRVIREGDPGDRYYAVGDGTLDVTRDDQLLQRIGRGDGFGEIALIRDVPRTATVTARTDTLLYALEGELFVDTITGNASAGRAAGDVVDGHLRSQGTDRPDDTPASG